MKRGIKAIRVAGARPPGIFRGRAARLPGRRRRPCRAIRAAACSVAHWVIDVRLAVENQIYQAIDHYGSQVPGGEHFTPEAKNAASGILDNLQRQLEAQAANRMGGLGSGLFGEGEGGNQGSQL